MKTLAMMTVVLGCGGAAGGALVIEAPDTGAPPPDAGVDARALEDRGVVTPPKPDASEGKPEAASPKHDGNPGTGPSGDPDADKGCKTQAEVCVVGTCGSHSDGCGGIVNCGCAWACTAFDPVGSREYVCMSPASFGTTLECFAGKCVFLTDCSASTPCTDGLVCLGNVCVEP